LTHIGKQPSGVSEALAQLRYACGVVACATLGFWATGGALVGVSFAFRGTPLIALIADGGIVFTYLVYLGSAFVFAYKHRKLSAREVASSLQCRSYGTEPAGAL
jgi:hypothetical protein